MTSKSKQIKKEEIPPVGSEEWKKGLYVDLNEVVAAIEKELKKGADQLELHMPIERMKEFMDLLKAKNIDPKKVILVDVEDMPLGDYIEKHGTEHLAYYK